MRAVLLKYKKTVPRLPAGTPADGEDMANILIVEDDANMRILMSARLKGRHNVLLAKDGAEALELAVQQSRRSAPVEERRRRPHGHPPRGGRREKPARHCRYSRI